MKYIIGCGGLAKEVLFLLEEVEGSLNDFKGFIDYKPNKNKIFCRGNFFDIIDESYFLQNMNKKDEIELFLGIGDPKKIKNIQSKFNDFLFPNLIHKSIIGDFKSINLGKGNIIAPGCIFTVDISIGSFNIFNLNTTVGHDVIIQDGNIFNPGCNVSGNVNIESNNLFGTNSTILQGISIGSNNTLGASSLANKNIQNNSIMVGVPAKMLQKK